MLGEDGGFPFSIGISTVGILLDFLGAVLIVYFGLWPALNINELRYTEEQFKLRTRLFLRFCLLGLIMVITGVSMQLLDIAETYHTRFLF